MRPLSGCAFISLFILLPILGALPGCRKEAQAPETPRPVLVARAAAAQAGSLNAYAGEIRAREESALAFRVGGKVLKRRVDVGDRVRAGDVLAELDPDDLRLQAEALQAQLTAADAQLTRVRADQRRIATLADDQFVSRSLLDQQNAAVRAAEGDVRAARARLDVARNQAAYALLRAPRNGLIAARQIEAGQVVGAGQSAFTLAADSGREVAFAVPESAVRDIRVGQPVLIEPWSDRGRRWTGRIREIAPAADPQARTYAVRAALDGEAAAAVDLGQSARVYIQAAEPGGDRIEIPLTALQPGADGGAAVWVADIKAGRVRKVGVRVGPYGAERVSVLSGLKPQDWVVIAGGHLLQDGQPVQPVDRTHRPILSNPTEPN